MSKKRGPSCLEGEAPEVSIKRRSLESLGVQMESDLEYDEARIQARMKQIGYGKNTVAYDNYVSLVPKDKRRGYGEHPRTPDPYEKQSKRAFDGRIRAWRRQLHQWDTNAPEEPKLVPAVDDKGETIFPIKFVPPSEVKASVLPVGQTPETGKKSDGDKEILQQTAVDPAVQDNIVVDEEEEEDDVL